MSDPSSTDKPEAQPALVASASSALALHVGQRARFVGFRAASWEYPVIKIGESCEIVSVKQPNQVGFDYWARMDGGARFAFQSGELEEMPND